MSDTPSRSKAANRAVMAMNLRKGTLVCKIAVTPPGLLAIGGLVSSILLSTAALVWVSTSVARERPVSEALRGVLRRR